ncbi:cyclopropane fatty acyl phospholipid synthase [Endozoicomonas sp. 4G]|uniref:cyclopropane fatty acyl phospholipid synthase n=1 Tax=Endozoicomonas sp. 4G TaxID=2872754 RepID=UPI00207886C8|nr:cyclopropane fatty acyl phospholipid synthase [Endozoicomonas sp. 4G]
MNNVDLFSTLLAPADIQINGDRAWDIQLHDESALDTILAQGSLGFGETYMKGLWDCLQLDELVNRLLRHKLEDQLSVKAKLLLGITIGQKKIANLFNRQSVAQSSKDVPFHYDIGNDLFQIMLDDRMTYTCGYWKEASNLNEAQAAKLNLICRKLGLMPDMRVLDIGCGWGSFMNYAAENYGVMCDGLTLSKEQAQLGQELSHNQSLPVRFMLKDYREYEPTRQYDRIASIGMIEHVGPDNFSEYFQRAHRLLKDDGIFLLHTIGSPVSQNKTDPWIHKYIFPNGVIPSISQLTASMEGLFNVEDIHNIGPNYDKTLMAWCNNFENNWEQIAHKYDKTFYRMWRYYLLSCAGAFRSRNLNLLQFVLTKPGSALPPTARLC